MLESSLKVCKALDKYEYEAAEHHFGTDVPAWANNMQEFRILNISEADKENLLNDIDQILSEEYIFQHEFNTVNEGYNKSLQWTVLVLQIRKLPKGQVSKNIIDNALKQIKEEYGIVVDYNNWHYLEF